MKNKACSTLLTQGPEPKESVHAPPSQLPLATVVKDSNGFVRTSTASMCPSKLSTNGFAKILSSLAAFNALVLSLAFAKGCIVGLRFRWTGVGSPGRNGT